MKKLNNEDLENISGGAWLTDEDVKKYKQKGYFVYPVPGYVPPDGAIKSLYRVFDFEGARGEIDVPDSDLDAYLQKLGSK